MPIAYFRDMTIFLSLILSFVCFFFISSVIFKSAIQRSLSSPSPEDNLDIKYQNPTNRLEMGKKRNNIISIIPIETFISLVMAIASMVLWGKFVVSFSLLLAGFIAPKIVEKVKIKRRLKLFIDQLADGITIIANSLNSGFSLQQSIDTMVKQMPPPISYEFLLALREHRLGKPMEVALADMQRRVPSNELHLIVTAISLSRETGGNLSQVLESIANMLREKIRIEGKIDALTSNGKLQGLLIGFLPLVMGMLMYIIDPDLIAPMYKTQVGWALIGLMTILEMVGLVIIRKIVTIQF